MSTPYVIVLVHAIHCPFPDPIPSEGPYGNDAFSENFTVHGCPPCFRDCYPSGTPLIDGLVCCTGELRMSTISGVIVLGSCLFS
jgi:hypothetical protein